MFRPIPDELRPDGLNRTSNDPWPDLSHLRWVRARQRRVALELTAVVRDPELRVRLPGIHAAFTVRA